ncbi:MAG: thioredoxin-disulfide reductase [Candidatus Levybacteria bacterium]|nr:thioredoxin-disulfide reductase [Candidatus Levybacteria bacterium]
MYDVIIIGSGPAGLTAAIYTTRANLKTLIIAGSRWGGQLMLTSLVENFPGFPEGIHGPELMMNMRKQAERHGAEIVEVDFKEGDFSQQPFKITADSKTYEGKSVIIATGADTRWLDVPGEKEKIGRGVSSCAPCDAAFFRNKKVIVVGGGDSAMEEALYLTQFAESITVIHRKDVLRASQIMQDKAKNNPKINFIFNTEVEEIQGDQKVEKVKLKTQIQKTRNTQIDRQSDNQTIRQSDISDSQSFPSIPKDSIIQQTEQEILWEMPIDGVFVAIGHMPNSTVFKGIELDNKGYIAVKQHTKTNVEGVFVAGDVHDAKYKQAITAAGFGCAAALEVEKWLRGH